jgi:hypothetical protein
LTDVTSDGEDDPHVVVETSVIPQVRHVRIYESTIQHVIDYHPEIGRNAALPVIQDAVAAAIRDPASVEESYNRSYVFVEENSTDATGNPLRVAVRVVSETSARMKSFYFAEPETEKPVIYRRSDDGQA